MEVQNFLDLLIPGSGESLVDFNNVESEEKRRGVIPIDIFWVETQLERLRVTNDIEGFGAQLDKIDLDLKDYQHTYDIYFGMHCTVANVRLTLGAAISNIFTNINR
jgi:hypothetical protein